MLLTSQTRTSPRVSPGRHLRALKRGPSEPRRGGGDGDASSADVDTVTDIDDMSGGRAVVCRHCHSQITTTGARITIADRHDHTFINPGGWEYRIGCFAKAPGCSQRGEISTYWSWFEGYSWQMDVCASCGEHLGWLFRAVDDDLLGQFHGLILNRLEEIEEDGDSP
jgi:hypothetical protein